ATQWAVWWRHRARFGVALSDASVNFTGKPLVPIEQERPPFWRYNATQKQWLLSMQHISDKNIAEIVAFLSSVKPRFYSGYPSIIAETARLSLRYGLRLKQDAMPEVVFFGAEKVLDYQRELIAEWLPSARLTDQYGLSEGNCNFSKCEYDNYHEDF